MRTLLLALTFSLAALPLPAQENALLRGAAAEKAFTRAQQLVEATMITVPGLARAAEPILENLKQAGINLQAAGYRDSSQTYSFLTNLRAYLSLAESLPKPYPFPEEARRQMAELREAVERLEAHFEALLRSLELRLRNPDRDNLKRYAEENLKVGPPQPGRPRVVFLGDSITDGWRLNEYFPESDFINRGIGGQITGQMLGRMKADVIDLKPRAVVILGGTNDIARGVELTTIQNNLTMMAELAKAHRIKVILASLLPVHDYHKDRNPRFERTRQRPPQKILELNDWIRNYCRRERHTYLDYYSAMVDGNGYLKKELSDDGLHPNAAGYRVMAPLVWNAIVRVVPKFVGPRRPR